MHLHKRNVKFSSMLHIQPHYMEPIPFSTHNSLQLNWLSQLHLSALQWISCRQETALMTQLPTQITQELSYRRTQPTQVLHNSLSRQAKGLSEQLRCFISPVPTTIFAQPSKGDSHKVGKTKKTPNTKCQRKCIFSSRYSICLECV